MTPAPEIIARLAMTVRVGLDIGQPDRGHPLAPFKFLALPEPSQSYSGLLVALLF
jgi:hypothetical protein